MPRRLGFLGWTTPTSLGHAEPREAFACRPVGILSYLVGTHDLLYSSSRTSHPEPAVLLGLSSTISVKILSTRAVEDPRVLSSRRGQRA
jgi:hypothetical protein